MVKAYIQSSIKIFSLKVPFGVFSFKKYAVIKAVRPQNGKFKSFDDRLGMIRRKTATDVQKYHLQLPLCANAPPITGEPAVPRT